MRTLFAIGLTLLVLPVLAGGVLGSGGGGADEASYLHPVHEIHAEMDMACADCHEGVAEAGDLTGLLPEKAVCANCHDVDDTDACGTCHVDVDEPMGYAETAAAMRFPHGQHVQDDDCSGCHQLEHGAMTQPGHDTCRTCHTTVAGFQDCQVCHLESVEHLRPRSHEPQYMAYHALDALWDERSCESCHTQSDCQDCHNGDNVRPRVHELNFVSTHALEARSNETLCATCHVEAEFCASCHRAEQVLPRSHSRADWLAGGGGGRHAEEAVFNIESCIACHDAGHSDPVCAQCHGR